MSKISDVFLQQEMDGSWIWPMGFKVTGFEEPSAMEATEIQDPGSQTSKVQVCHWIGSRENLQISTENHGFHMVFTLKSGGVPMDALFRVAGFSIQSSTI